MITAGTNHHVHLAGRVLGGELGYYHVRHNVLIHVGVGSINAYPLLAS